MKDSAVLLLALKICHGGVNEGMGGQTDYKDSKNVYFLAFWDLPLLLFLEPKHRSFT